MKSLKYKDQKLRKIYKNIELKRKILKFIFINTVTKSPISISMLKFKNKLNRISKTKIKSRCILTNRSRSLNKNFSISRIILREYLDLGIIPGFKRAVW